MSPSNQKFYILYLLSLCGHISWYSVQRQQIHPTIPERVGVGRIAEVGRGGKGGVVEGRGDRETTTTVTPSYL